MGMLMDHVERNDECPGGRRGDSVGGSLSVHCCWPYRFRRHRCVVSCDSRIVGGRQCILRRRRIRATDSGISRTTADTALVVVTATARFCTLMKRTHVDAPRRIVHDAARSMRGAVAKLSLVTGRCGHEARHRGTRMPHERLPQI